MSHNTNTIFEEHQKEIAEEKNPITDFISGGWKKELGGYCRESPVTDSSTDWGYEATRQKRTSEHLTALLEKAKGRSNNPLNDPRNNDPRYSRPE